MKWLEHVTHERRNAYEALIGDSKERRDLLEDLDIERILLRQNFKKYYEEGED
jgi:hypothetical protein